MEKWKRNKGQRIETKRRVIKRRNERRKEKAHTFRPCNTYKRKENHSLLKKSMSIALRRKDHMRREQHMRRDHELCAVQR